MWRVTVYNYHNNNSMAQKNTISIDSNALRWAEMYAKLHNMSVSDVVEKSIALLVGKRDTSKPLPRTSDFNAAMELMDCLMIAGGNPVPADENGKGAVADAKYGA